MVATLDNEFLGDLINPRDSSLEEWTLGVLESIKGNPVMACKRLPFPRVYPGNRQGPRLKALIAKWLHAPFQLPFAEWRFYLYT